MIDVTILAVTENPSWLEFFWTELRSVQGTRLVVTGSMEEACDLLSCADARLIVVDWQDATVSSEQMDQLLWANSILAHPATVLVVAESYRRDHALSLFQMGVDDYIGLSEHSDQLRTILDRLLARTTTHSIRSPQTGFPGTQAGAGSTAPASALGCGGVFGLRAWLATSSMRSCGPISRRGRRRRRRRAVRDARRSGAGAIQSQGSGSGSYFLESAQIPRIELSVAALRRHVLAVDKKGEHRRRGLEDMAGRDDQVGPLAGFQRPDPIGDTQNLRRSERHRLERNILGKAECDGRRRLVGDIPAIGRPGGSSSLGADRNGDTRCVQPRRVRIRGVVGIMIVGRHVQRSTDEHRHSGLLERVGNLPGLATSRDHRLELQFLGDRQGVENLGAMVGQEDHWLLALRIGDKSAEARVKGRGSHTLGPGLGHDLAVAQRPAKVLAD